MPVYATTLMISLWEMRGKAGSLVGWGACGAPRPREPMDGRQSRRPRGSGRLVREVVIAVATAPGERDLRFGLIVLRGQISPVRPMI
jgi:hypothetical protein